jgi:hypothetical protein
MRREEARLSRSARHPVGCAVRADHPQMQIALRDFERRLVSKVGGMLTIAVGIVLAALRFFPAPHP